MLLAIILVYSHLGATDFSLLSVSDIKLEYQKIIWLNTLLQQQGSDQQIKLSVMRRNSLILSILSEKPPFPTQSSLGRGSQGRCEKDRTGVHRKTICTSVGNSIGASSPCHSGHKSGLWPVEGTCIASKGIKGFASNSTCSQNLVVFGDNLSSNIHYKPYSNSIKYLVGMSYKLEAILFGILVSDGYLKKNDKGNTYLYLKQGFKNFEYLWFIFNQFSHYCGSYPAIAYTTVNGKKFKGIYFKTRSFPFLSK